MTLFTYMYENDKFDWFTHTRGHELKVVLNVFRKKSVKDCSTLTTLDLEKNEMK